MVVTWSHLANIVLGQRDNPLGMGSTVPLGTVPLVIPFPQKGNGILLLCGFILAIIIPFPQKGNGILLLCGFILAIIIIIGEVVVNLVCSSKGWSDFNLLLKLSQ